MGITCCHVSIKTNTAASNNEVITANIRSNTANYMGALMRWICLLDNAAGYTSCGAEHAYEGLQGHWIPKNPTLMEKM